MKLLVDNCLSEELAHVAIERGHAEATHVRWIGKGDWKDWNLKGLIDDGGYTFVTKNSVDFRGPKNNKGSKGEHAKLALHAGLICLNGPLGMDLDLQLELFLTALDAIDEDAGAFYRRYGFTPLPAPSASRLIMKSPDASASLAARSSASEAQGPER